MKRLIWKKNKKHNGSSDGEVPGQEVTSRQPTCSSTGDCPLDVADATSIGSYMVGPTQSPTPPFYSDVLANPGVSRDDQEYSMRNKRHGVALIFSHENFDARRYADEVRQPPTRKGTQIDRDALRDTFEWLGFEVRCFNDLYRNQISNELRQVAQEDHRNEDCIVVAVLSHGERDGKLNARDCDYNISELWEPLTARWCPTLAGKPKLFFIQACKGSGLDQGVNVSNIVRDVADSMCDSVITYPVPSYADILVSYSTFEGLYSYLNTKDGSWYVQTLCAQLKAHGKTMDLMSLLTEVNRIVGQNFRVKNSSDSQLVGMVQAPCFTSSLTRRLRFE